MKGPVVPGVSKSQGLAAWGLGCAIRTPVAPNMLAAYIPWQFYSTCARVSMPTCIAKMLTREVSCCGPSRTSLHLARWGTAGPAPLTRACNEQALQLPWR